MISIVLASEQRSIINSSAVIVRPRCWASYLKTFVLFLPIS
jgi:hypothetical protein